MNYLNEFGLCLITGLSTEQGALHKVGIYDVLMCPS
jgi:hypothetical protein